MLTVEYNPIEGRTLPDKKVKSCVENVIKLGMTHFCVGSSLFIDEFRCHVKRGNINANDIIFKFIDEDEVEHNIRCDFRGNLEHWPKGFCEYDMEVFSELAFGIPRSN